MIISNKKYYSYVDYTKNTIAAIFQKQMLQTFANIIASKCQDKERRFVFYFSPRAEANTFDCFVRSILDENDFLPAIASEMKKGKDKPLSRRPEITQLKLLVDKDELSLTIQVIENDSEKRFELHTYLILPIYSKGEFENILFNEEKVKGYSSIRLDSIILTDEITEEVLSSSIKELQSKQLEMNEKFLTGKFHYDGALMTKNVSVVVPQEINGIDPEYAHYESIVFGDDSIVKYNLVFRKEYSLSYISLFGK